MVSGRNFNSSKLLCMSFLPAKMKMIESKMKEVGCSQAFFRYKSMGIFSRRSRAANSAILGPTWPNFELVRDIMDIPVTCKYEEESIKNEGARVFITFLPIISLWKLSVAIRPAKFPDLGRILSAFSLHCRLSGFEVHFTGEIENLLALCFSDRLFYYLR